MSFQAYVDQSLLGTGKVDGAAILSAEGDNVLAVSRGFRIQAEEIQILQKGFHDPAPLYSSGLKIGGQKYMVIKADDRRIYGKKAKEGVCAVKTKQTIIVAHYPEDVRHEEIAGVVEPLAEYLMEAGY